jgi:hypothetical protein
MVGHSKKGFNEIIKVFNHIKVFKMLPNRFDLLIISLNSEKDEKYAKEIILFFSETFRNITNRKIQKQFQKEYQGINIMKILEDVNLVNIHQEAKVLQNIIESIIKEEEGEEEGEMKEEEEGEMKEEEEEERISEEIDEGNESLKSNEKSIQEEEEVEGVYIENDINLQNGFLNGWKNHLNPLYDELVILEYHDNMRAKIFLELLEVSFQITEDRENIC